MVWDMQRPSFCRLTAFFRVTAARRFEMSAVQSVCKATALICPKIVAESRCFA
jgi:hypothetical protein